MFFFYRQQKNKNKSQTQVLKKMSIKRIFVIFSPRPTWRFCNTIFHHGQHVCLQKTYAQPRIFLIFFLGFSFHARQKNFPSSKNKGTPDERNTDTQSKQWKILILKILFKWERQSRPQLPEVLQDRGHVWGRRCASAPGPTPRLKQST